MRKLVVPVALLASVACGENVAAPPTPSASAWGGPSEVTALDTAALTDASGDPDALRDLLDGAGFAGAVARTWVGERTGEIRRVEVRAVRFATADGSADFLAWIEGHPEELIGAADQLRSSGDALVFTHEPGGCCPNKDTSSVLQAWARDDLVWSVVVSGPSATVAVADGIRASMEEGGASAPPSPTASSRY